MIAEQYFSKAIGILVVINIVFLMFQGYLYGSLERTRERVLALEYSVVRDEQNFATLVAELNRIFAENKQESPK